jgi:hypothetical protein
MGKFKDSLPTLRAEIVAWDRYHSTFRVDGHHTGYSLLLQIELRKLEAALKAGGDEKLAQLAFEAGKAYARLEKLRLRWEIETGKNTMRRREAGAHYKYRLAEGRTPAEKRSNTLDRMRKRYAELHKAQPELNRTKLNKAIADEFNFSTDHVRKHVKNPVPTRRGRPPKRP